jgi:hypothetical protein
MLHAAALSRRDARHLVRDLARLFAHRATAASLGRALADTRTPSSTRTCEIAESFEVWQIDAPAIVDSPPRVALRDVARPTARTHHQLHVGGVPVAYARSAMQGRMRRVINLSVSPLAEAIDRAIGYLDVNARWRGEARMLLVPARRTVALWLVPRDRRRASEVVVLVADGRVRTHRKPTDASRFVRALMRARASEGLITAPQTPET